MDTRIQASELGGSPGPQANTKVMQPFHMGRHDPCPGEPDIKGKPMSDNRYYVKLDCNLLILLRIVFRFCHPGENLAGDSD